MVPWNPRNSGLLLLLHGEGKTFNSAMRLNFSLFLRPSSHRPAWWRLIAAWYLDTCMTTVYHHDLNLGLVLGRNCRGGHPSEAYSLLSHRSLNNIHSTNWITFNINRNEKFPKISKSTSDANVCSIVVCISGNATALAYVISVVYKQCLHNNSVISPVCNHVHCSRWSSHIRERQARGEMCGGGTLNYTHYLDTVLLTRYKVLY